MSGETKKLLPCPFCGGGPVWDYYTVGVWDESEDRWNVTCDTCGITFEEGFKTRKEAIEAWNRRADPERIIKIGQRSGKTLESAIDYLHSVGWLQEHDRILTESAEPERKKGEWVDYDAEDINDYPIEAWQSCRCTSCGKWHTTPYKYNFDQYPFCPNCGAEMTRGE